MARNWLRVQHEGDSIQLSWQRGQSNPRSAPTVALQHPFDDQALTDLRWYLEEYLHFPYGLAPENTAKIEQKFQIWGEQLFELVFRRSEKAREFFHEATREGLDRCELVISSDNPAVLNLPWELLYSPDYQFLAPLLGGMSRSLNSQAVRSEMGQLPQDKLNILLVIARPYGERDIALKTIARPMLEVAAQILQNVNIKVLRPPSFEQFERELNAHKGVYHIVHFDGHGDFDPNSQGLQHQLGSAAGQGVLVFEKANGSPQVVTAAQVAQNLADCRVPIFVLNACKSAREGEGKFSSVATRLVSLGAKGVVAMAYSVYAVAAKHFIRRMYGELIAGASLSTAVAAGRREVLNQRSRPSPKGDKPLQDWLVPVLYQQESYTPFIPKTTAPSFEELMATNATLNKAALELPDAGAYGFIGRDYDILRLERAFRQNHVVLLKGMAGVGKTELACGFARWLDETQGRTGGIFFISFADGKGLSYVINTIGRKLGGDRFSQLMSEQQRAVVLQYLQTNPCLLIWDNFEPVAGFPAGNEPLLPETERDNLKQFLKQLRGGQSWVLITSRREEPWLDCGYTLQTLLGLSQADAEELAAKILQSVGVDRAKLPAEYLELLKLLGGHPLSLRVVLPHLKTQSAVQLIDALQQGLDTLDGTPEKVREKSLTVSLDYSFAKLSERARRHSPFLALFSERVDAHWLHAFSSDPDDENGQVYQAVFGENLQKADWLGLLNEAAEAGILEHLGETIYKIHPALPWYLRQRLSEQHADQEVSELEKKLLIFYALLADRCRVQLISNTERITFVLRVEEPNLLQNLRLAERQQDWSEAQAILQALGEMYQRIGRKPEFKSLRQRGLNQIGTHLADAKAKGQDASNYWMYLRGMDANEAFLVADLDGARAIYQEILNELTSLNDPSVHHNIAVFYHNLGVVAQEQRQFEAATAFYHKALKIRENVEDFYNAADEYHQLGMIAQEQRQFEEATAFYHKALKIFEAAQNWHNAAGDYHQLGMVAQEQRQFEEATAFYHKALKIFEAAQDWDSAAKVYHNLGVVAQEQRQFEAATAFYHKALKIFEDTQNWHKAAIVYHQLGRVAQEQGQFEAATAFYHKAFEIFQQSQDWYKASVTLRKWGNVLEAQENWAEALQRYIFALVISLFCHSRQSKMEGKAGMQEGSMTAPRDPKPTVSFIDSYCDYYRKLFPEVRSFESFKNLHMGMLSDIKRKTLPEIAKVVGLENGQSLHHFLTESPWEVVELRQYRLGRVLQALQGRPLTLIIDETGDPKQGSATDYVKRQYLGKLGKVDNGIVAVTAYGVMEEMTFPLSFEVYKPRERLKPEDKYQSKPQIAAGMIRELLAVGFQFELVLADSLYGESDSNFISVLNEFKLKFVVAIRSNHGVWLPAGARVRYNKWRKFNRIFSDDKTEVRYIREIIYGQRGQLRYWQISTDSITLPESSTWWVMTQVPSITYKEVGNLFGLRTWVEYGLKQSKNELGWADFRLTHYPQIQKWWEIVCSAYLLVSLYSEHLNHRQKTQNVFTEHRLWNENKGWKNLLNNLRLILQPFIYFNLMQRWLKVFPIPQLSLGFSRLLSLMNRFANRLPLPLPEPDFQFSSA